MSALHWASENGHLETVKLLLKRGSNASLVSKFGETALTLAIRRKHYEIYELLRVSKRDCELGNASAQFSLLIMFDFSLPDAFE